MKIKKPMTVKAPAGESSTGGAAIADRFKLDPVDNASSKKKAGTTGKKAAMVALIFGFIGLALAIALTLTIYKHWEYLMPARGGSPK